MNANSNPEINDWNEDGKKDLIVGEQSYVSPNTGNIRVYLNSGTNSNPIFTTYSIIESSGSQIYHYRVNPRVYDLDQDGLKDLIVGQNDGRLYFYKNVGTNPKPSFSGYEMLKTTGGISIDAYAGSRFCFVDWKGDGDPDLLVSGYYGFVEYYENAKLGVGEEGRNSLVTGIRIFPNPVTETVVLNYLLAEPSRIEVAVISADGRLVSRPINTLEDAGKHQFSWKVSDLPAGIYFVRFSAGSTTEITRMLVVR